MEKGKGVHFGDEVSRVLPLIIREVSRRQMSVFSKGGLGLPHVVVLDLLRERGACRMGELAGTLHLTMSAVTGIVDRMIKLGLVKRERCVEDRRVVRVVLVKKGEEAARRVSEERRNTAEDIFSVLGASEKREYLRLLRKVYNNLKKKR